MIPHTTFRISETGRKMLAALAIHYGLTKTGVIEWLVRERYRATLGSRRRRAAKAKP